MDSNIKHLYDTMISRGYTGLGDFSNFEGKMKDSGKRKLVYDHLMQDDYFSEIGDFSKFESALGYSPVERKNYVSQSSANPAPISLRQEVEVPMKDQSEYVNPWTNSPDYNFESLRKKGKIETATPPPPTEYEKDPSFMNTWAADFIQRTGGQGLNRLGGGFGFLDKAAKDVSNMGLGTYGGMFGDSAKLLKEAGQKLMDKGDRYKGKSFTDLWKEGDYIGSIGNLFMEGGSMIIPQIAAAMATGGTSAAGLMGASVYSDKLDQLDESNPDMPELAKRVNAISTSAFELLSEKLSLGPVVKWLKGVYNSKGKDVAQKELAGAIENMLGKAYKDTGLLFAPVWEGVTEAASQIAENITDKVTGADPDKNISEGVFEAFGYGVAGGAPIGLIGYGKNKYDNYKYNKMSSPEPSTNSSNATNQGVNTPPQFTKSIIDDAFEQGRNMSDKGDLRDLSLQMEASRTALTEKNPNLVIRMEQYIDNGASENQINEILKGVDNETRELAYDFYINTQKIKGVEDKSIENINNEVNSYMSDNIIPYVSISPNGRQVISTATFKEGLENKKVYIRSINGDNVIISDNGNNRMVPMSSLSDIEENDVEQIKNSYRQQLLVTRQSELDMAMNHNPKTQLPKPGLVIWNGDNAFILQGQDENGDWIAQPAALDKETGQVAPKAGSAPAMPITERDILTLQDAMYDAQQVNVVSPEDDNVASADAEITTAPPVEDAINQPTSEIETESAIDQTIQPSNVETPSMVMREDGTPDFVSSGTDMTLDFLHDKYGEKMPKKIEVTRKAFDEDLKKASEKLDKAQEAYDNAPIGKEDKVEAALIKARQEYDAIKVEADFWANLDNRLKEESEKATATSGQVIDISEKEDTEPVDIKNEDVVTQEGASGEVKESGSNLFNYFTGSLSELIEQAKKSAGKLIKKIVAPVSDRLRNDLEIKGVSITSDYNHVIDNNAIRHTLKQHGGNSEIKRGQVPVNDSDFDKISDIVENYDDIKVEDGKRGDVNIIYSKTFNDGTTIFVEEKRDKRKELAAVTMWKMKNPILTGANSDNATPIPDLNRIKRQAEREGGELLILTPKGAAASLSTLPDNSSSTDKGSISSSENQANEVKSFVAPSPKESENPLDYAERIVEAKRLHDEELKVDTTPSEAQKEAGNYKKGHIKINGFDVTIEQPAGSVRSGKDASGKEWSQVMNNTYGYIRGTKGVDGDHIDVFLGPDMNSDMVYVVDQVNTDGSFDEHKVMMGFSSLEDARSAYLSNYEEGWQGLGNITGVALDEFKKWIDSSIRKTKPFSEYRSVDFIEEERPGSDVRFRSIGEKGAANLNKAETIESSINDWSNKLNTPVRVIHDVDDINDTDENMLARKRDSKGWYDTSTGEIVIVSPNSTSVGDAQRTFLHEVVGHHGLRELFGDDFDTFLDNVYRNANEDIRKNIIDRTKGNPLNLREATEEYLAELAERGFDNKVDRSLWEKIKDAFLDMLRKAGISLDFKLSDNDLRYILWRSYKNLEQGNLMDVAEDTVMRNDLGVGDFSVRFREAKTEVENEEPLNKEMVDAWDKVASSDSFKFKEAMVDSLTAIDEFLKLLAKKTKSKILDYENPYYALIALSSKNKADMDSFDSKFLNPLNEAIRALIGDVSEVSKKGLRRTWDWSKGPLRDLVKYVQSKHGIERNRDMSVRDGIETLKAFDVDALSKMGVISESDLKNAKKTAEKVAEEKGSEAYKKTYDKVLGKELKKGVDKGKAERSAEIAADYRQSFVKSEIYNKEMDKYKEKVTGTLIDRWEDSKKDILKKGLAWDEEQKELDREALSFQWKLGDNSYGVILGKDYSGLSSVFKPSEDGANKDKWLSDAYDFVRDYESTHNMVLVDNLWDKVHNVSEYTLRRQYESGLISKSYMDKNLSRFKYFIPLRGFSDNIASDVYDYIDATEIKMGNPVKTAKGRISEADNPFAGLIHVGYGSITAGNRNLAKQRFLNLASNHDTGGLITIDNIWVRNVGTEENPEWVESIPQIPDNASGEEVAKAVKDHEEMMRELREEGKAELIKGGRSDIPYKTLYDQRSQHQVQVFVGGNRYVMTVNGNPRLAQAVNGLTNPDVKDDLAYVVARNLKTFMAGAFTSKNVAFSFANLIRDTPYANNSVFVTENFRYFKDFSGNQRRALFGLRSLGRNLYKYRRGEIDISDKEQAIFKEFMDNGGATGYTFVETQKEYAKDLANKLEKLSDGNIGKLSPKELVSTVFECFEFMGNVAELVNRYAAYKTSREHGRSIDRSINDAKEVSVNFNKKGAGKKTKSDKWYINTAAWISEYGRDWVLFFNAAVQSMYKEYSMLINHPIKGIGSRIAPLIFMGSSVSLLNNMFMPMLFAYLGWDSDDDDRDYFDSLSDHERQNNICIRLTHGRWLKIPLSPELANYFKIGDIIAGQLSGKREVEAMDVVKTGIDMVSPLNINWEYDSWKFALNLLPTVVQPIAQNASNVNLMGNPIYKTSMNKANDYDPEYTKVYRSTSTTMVELSRALNSLTGGDDVKRGLSFNPATWQNIFSGYTGGFGTVALGVSDLVLDILSGEDGDMPVSRYPLLSRFLTGGDKDLKLSRMNSIYNKKVVDFVSEMDHDYKGYLEKSMDPSINILDRAEYIVKLEKFMKSDDFKKSQELSQYVRAISDMERFLREVGSDNDSLENQVYELKLRALEIFEDSDE